MRPHSSMKQSVEFKSGRSSLRSSSAARRRLALSPLSGRAWQKDGTKAAFAWRTSERIPKPPRERPSLACSFAVGDKTSPTRSEKHWRTRLSNRARPLRAWLSGTVRITWTNLPKLQHEESRRAAVCGSFISDRRSKRGSALEVAALIQLSQNSGEPIGDPRTMKLKWAETGMLPSFFAR